MSKKYFSLIAGPTIHQANGDKVLPQSAFSTLLTAEEMLKKIVEDQEEYRKSVIQESELIKEQAVREGFEKGYSDWINQIAKLEDEIKKVREDIQKMVMPIALKAAKKIVAEELKSSPEAILNIVTSTLKSVSQHKKIILYVNKQDYELLEKSKQQIKKLFEQLESLSIRERDDVEAGGCVIETEGGIINAQLKDRWLTLDAAFEALYHQLKAASTGDA